MFVGHEVLLEVSFALARARLVQRTEDGALISASEDAYGRGTAGLTRVGAAGLSKLMVPGLHRQMSPVLLRLRAAGLCGTGGWSRLGPRSFVA
jgi:hypothetical protein